MKPNVTLLYSMEVAWSYGRRRSRVKARQRDAWRRDQWMLPMALNPTRRTLRAAGRPNQKALMEFLALGRRPV